MSRFSVFYCSLPAVGSGIKPVEAADPFEAEQIVQRDYPGAITASLSPSITDQGVIRRLFVDWLQNI